MMCNGKDSLRVLITGAAGFVGGALFSKLQYLNPLGVDFGLGIEPCENNLHNIDLREKNKVKILFKKYSPDTVFHFAALTSPQRNEDNVQLATDSHIKVTKNIIDNIGENTHLIFLSTDKIFDGSDPFPNEEAKANPLWVYGRLKWQCENMIYKRVKRFHIFRLPIVHSMGDCFARSKEAGPGSFVDKAIIELKAAREVVAFDNVQRCFLRLRELVRLLEIAMNDKHYGVYHVGTAMMSYYERIRNLGEEEKVICEGKLIPKKGKALPMIQNLNTDKLKKTFNITLT